MTASHDQNRLEKLIQVAPTRFKNPDKALEQFGPLTELYADMLNRGDEIADPVSREVKSPDGGKTRSDLDLALTQGADAVRNPSQALSALLNQIETVPNWVDWDMVDDGGTALLSLGPDIRFCLFAGLAAGYNSGAAVKPLARTARFISQAEKRSEETAVWLIKTLMQNSLRRGAPGYISSVRVRMIHSMVRCSLDESPTWDKPAWGAPLNMADTARGIAGEFTVVPIDAAKRLGYRLSNDEIAAIHHLFRYVGYLLGVPESILPKDETDARTFMSLVELTNDGPDEDCFTLINSLVDIQYERLRRAGKPLAANLSRKLAYGYIRSFAGKEVSDRLQIEDTVFKFAPSVGKLIVQHRDRKRRTASKEQRRALCADYASTALAALSEKDVVDSTKAATPIAQPAEHQPAA